MIVAILAPPLLGLVYFATRPNPFGFRDSRIFFGLAITLLVAVGLIVSSFYQAVINRP
jgi:hypothetical protein